MTAPLKSIEGSGDISAVMREIGLRARAASRVLALAPAGQKDRALEAMAAAVGAQASAILSANAEDVAEAKAAGITGAFLDRLTLDAGRVEAIAAGIGVVARAQGSRWRSDGILDPAEWHANRAGARAARGDRYHLRKPAQRDGRCRRALPESRQRGDPARGVRQHALQPGHSCGSGATAWRAQACRRPRCSSCRPATARRSA